MFILGPLGFTAPYALLVLLVLPLLWWLLRVTPPPPKVIAFPAIRLLRDLVPPEETASRTPLWLILFRMFLAACIIVGLAGPVLHPETQASATGPLLIIVDNGWASGVNWAARQAVLGQALDRAEHSGRTLAVLPTAPTADGTLPVVIGPGRAASLRGAIEALQPQPWPVKRVDAAKALGKLSLSSDAEVLWLSDGLDTPDSGVLADALAKFTDPKLILPGAVGTADLLLPPSLTEAKLTVGVVRPVNGAETETEVRALANDGRIIGSARAKFSSDAKTANAVFNLPVELSNEIDRLEIAGQHSVGATVLLDNRWRRRPVGVVSGAGSTQSLLSGNPYLKAALQPFADLREGTLDTLLKHPLSTLILDDPPSLSEADQATLFKWIESGGVLIRFAGPHLSASGDTLLPVKLRTGDRALGGALSWSKPENLAPFPDGSPFAGLAVPQDVTVSRQLLAEPSPDLASHTWAALTDGTPLVTATAKGKGWLVLVHTTAGPDWSNLSLSGLFANMLRRVSELAAGVAEDGQKAGTLAPLSTLDGLASLHDAPPTALPVEAAKFDATEIAPSHPPGYYGAGGGRRALNLSQHFTTMSPLPAFSGLKVTTYQAPVERSLMPLLLGLSLLLLAADTIIGLWLKGLLGARMSRSALAGALLLLAGTLAAHAQVSREIGNGSKIEQAATATTLGYVRTGDSEVDMLSAVGLKSLMSVVVGRTSVEEGLVQPVDLATDDLAVYPLLYWPVTDVQATPDKATIGKLNTYLANGGLILFDKRSPEDSVAGNTATLRRLTEGLDIPALEPVPDGHTLGKSFYLLDSFPGRYTDGTVWVEKTPSDQNDAVSSVVVGSNDWAAAWAEDETGSPMVQIDGGQHQREMAYRFGVNLVMYALTGNYKSDQIHTPIILQRLGK